MKYRGQQLIKQKRNTRSERAENKDRHRRPAAIKQAEKISGKITLQKKKIPGTGITQYPAEVGYHGTDNEKGLNPEE